MALGFVAAHLVNYAIICCSLLGENKDLLLPWCRNVWKIPTAALLSLLKAVLYLHVFVFFNCQKKQMWADKQAGCRVPGRQSPAAEANMWLTGGDRAPRVCVCDWVPRLL